MQISTESFHQIPHSFNFLNVKVFYSPSHMENREVSIFFTLNYHAPRKSYVKCCNRVNFDRGYIRIWQVKKTQETGKRSQVVWSVQS